MKIVLTIGGSDPSGGAGIQMDLKVFNAFGIYGLSAITALTIQNSHGVKDVFPVSGDHLYREIENLLLDFHVDGIKVGMLGSTENVMAVDRALELLPSTKIVMDPVLASSNGYPLLDEEALPALTGHFLSKVLLFTPNIPEASILTGYEIRNQEDMKRAARDIGKMGARYVLIKGGHLHGRPADIFYGDDDFILLEGQRIEKAPVHGTGCAFSAAIISGLVLGLSINKAVKKAKAFVARLIKESERLGKGAYYFGLVSNNRGE